VIISLAKKALHASLARQAYFKIVCTGEKKEVGNWVCESKKQA
jgi:hypothetical protein